MPAVKTGTGPWGEAIRYWLPRKNMRQADLARETEITEKTISSMARGFHTTTRNLEAVAVAFGVSIDEVLISPARQQSNEERKRMIQEAVEAALRAHQTPPPRASPITNEQAMDAIERNIEAEERRIATQGDSKQRQRTQPHAITKVKSRGRTK